MRSFSLSSRRFREKLDLILSLSKGRFFARRSSVPNPKFVTLCSTLKTNFGFDKDTSKFMILVWFWI